MQQVVSLTKHYVFSRLVGEIAGVTPGMSAESVRRRLASPHGELFDDLFKYGADGRVRDSVLMRTCREGPPRVALRVLWVALLSADFRLRKVLEAITTDDGPIASTRYSTNQIESLMNDITGPSSRKAASNLAHYFEQAQILVPAKNGSEIVGFARSIDTRDSVPTCVAYLAELRSWRDQECAQAISLGAHRWLNLSESRFEAAC